MSKFQTTIAQIEFIVDMYTDMTKEQFLFYNNNI